MWDQQYLSLASPYQTYSEIVSDGSPLEGMWLRLSVLAFTCDV